MPTNRLPDGTYESYRVMVDPATGQEVVFRGTGASRGDALNMRDAAIETGLKAFPGIHAKDGLAPIPAIRTLGIEGETLSLDDHEPLWVHSRIWYPDGSRTTERIFDWYEGFTPSSGSGRICKARRRFMEAAVDALKANGGFSCEAASLPALEVKDSK